MKALPKKISIAILCIFNSFLFGQSSNNLGEALKQKALSTLNQWKTAQNNGSYRTYARLYSMDFMGIKKVGKRVYQYAYRGWLKDRKRMFRKPFKVQVINPQVSFGREKVIVLFKQIWASRTYKDEGMKEIVFATEKGRLRIISEKMLSSEIKSKSGRTVFKNIPVIMNQFLVLSNSINNKWFINKLRLHKGVNYYTVLAPSRFNRLPRSVRELNGKTVTVMGAKGKLCKSKIKAIQIIGIVTPHFGTIQNWKTDKGSPAKIAKDIWNLSKGRGQKLVAVLENECKGALWATANTSQYRIFRSNNGASQKNKAFRLFQSLPAIKRIQKDYKSYGEKGFWLKQQEVQTMLFSNKRERFYYMGVASGDGCGQFYGEFWAIWKIKNGRWKLITNLRQSSSFFKPKTLYQHKGGSYFFTDENRSYEWNRKSFYQSSDVSRPNLDCGC